MKKQSKKQSMLCKLNLACSFMTKLPPEPPADEETDWPPALPIVSCDNVMRLTGLKSPDVLNGGEQNSFECFHAVECDMRRDYDILAP